MRRDLPQDREIMITLLRISSIVFLSAITLRAQADEPALESIFNGKDLEGWNLDEDNPWFSVEDGVLKVQSGPDKKGATLWTEKEYTDFVLELEFKFGEGTVDSGIFIKNNKEQIQIGISGSLERDMTALAYIPGKGYPFKNDEAVKLLKQDDWNHLKIRVRGKTYETWLNGEPVMTYTSDSAIEKGPLGIQLHGNRDMAIDFRQLKVARE